MADTTIPFYYSVLVKEGQPKQVGGSIQLIVNDGNHVSFSSIIDAVEYCTTHPIVTSAKYPTIYVIDITLQGQRLERLLPAQWMKLSIGFSKTVTKSAEALTELAREIEQTTDTLTETEQETVKQLRRIAKKLGRVE